MPPHLREVSLTRSAGHLNTETAVSQRPSRRGRRPCRAGSQGTRSDHGAEPFRDRHAGRADHPVHDVAAPAPHGRLWHPPRIKNGPALAGYGTEAVRDAITSCITTLYPKEEPQQVWMGDDLGSIPPSDAVVLEVPLKEVFDWTSGEPLIAEVRLTTGNIFKSKPYVPPFQNVPPVPR
jgi:hypothetical protein